MHSGYAGKYLEVDLSTDKITETQFSSETLRIYLGGRGLAAKVLMDRLGKTWQAVDPLGPDNIFMALTGPMTGFYPGGRICCSGKSPMSNGVVGSTAGTEFAHQLKAAGYDGVIITGKASSPVYVLVTDRSCEIRDAFHLWGKSGEETIKTLNKEVTAELTSRHPGTGLWREPGSLYIGPAGENMVRNAAVLTKLCHAAGYGGYGSVMGSKNLKAVVAHGTGMFPRVCDPEAVKQLIQEVHTHLLRDDSFKRCGTGYGGYSTGNSMSSEPVRNWQEEWHDERGFGGPLFETRYWVKKRWSDFGCSRSCLKIACIKTGKYKGDITDNPDYELQAFCGANLGIFSPEDAIHLSTVINNLGHTGIGGPSTMGLAAELYQRGILTEEDIGFPLEWGDTEAFDRLAHMVAHREGIGDILAEGAYRAALTIGEMKGVNVLPFTVHVKGIEVGAHGTRSDADFLAHDAGYAVSVQGGDHTSLASDGYHELSWSTFADSAVFCFFCAVGVPLEVLFEFMRAVTGYTTTIDEWRRENGARITTIQRALLLMGGPDIYWKPLKDDENPHRFYEPLPSGPYKGSTTNRDTVIEKRKTYFETLGWDERGIPTKETLEKTGLTNLEPQMSKLRE